MSGTQKAREWDAAIDGIMQKRGYGKLMPWRRDMTGAELYNDLREIAAHVTAQKDARIAKLEEA